MPTAKFPELYISTKLNADIKNTLETGKNMKRFNV